MAVREEVEVEDFLEVMISMEVDSQEVSHFNSADVLFLSEYLLVRYYLVNLSVYFFCGQGRFKIGFTNM